MASNTDFRQKLRAQLMRLIPTPTTSSAGDATQARPQALYESIAVGNTLAEIEDNAHRKWRGQ